MKLCWVNRRPQMKLKRMRFACWVTLVSGPDTHPSCLHLTSNQQQLDNNTAYLITNAIVVSS